MKLSKLYKKEQDKIRQELKEKETWKRKIYDRFGYGISCSLFASLTVNDLKRIYECIEEEEWNEHELLDESVDKWKYEKAKEKADWEAELREEKYLYRSEAYRPGFTKKIKNIGSKEELYKEAIDIILNQRSYLLGKECLYMYFKDKVPGIPKNIYKDELVKILRNDLTPTNIEGADKKLKIKLYLCDLMQLFGLSYKKMKNLIEKENIPYEKRAVNYVFKGQANVFDFKCVSYIYEVIKNSTENDK